MFLCCGWKHFIEEIAAAVGDWTEFFAFSQRKDSQLEYSSIFRDYCPMNELLGKLTKKFQR